MYQSIAYVNFLSRPHYSLSLTRTCIHIHIFYSVVYSFSFSLLTPHRVFILIVHPHNFLIRFAGRTREHSAARLLLFFLCMRTPSLLHYSGTSFLSPFSPSPASSSPFSSSLLPSSSSLLHILTALKTSHK